MERAAYLKELVDAYQAEVRGEATFSTLAEQATSEEEVDTWQTLARLESTTRERLIPLLQRYGLDTTPDPERRRLGEQRGRDRAAAGFAATVKSMEFLNAHEIALHEFATRALAGGGRDSLAPIRALLARGKA